MNRVPSYRATVLECSEGDCGYCEKHDERLVDMAQEHRERTRRGREKSHSLPVRFQGNGVVQLMRAGSRDSSIQLIDFCFLLFFFDRRGNFCCC